MQLHHVSEQSAEVREHAAASCQRMVNRSKRACSCIMSVNSRQKYAGSKANRGNMIIREMRIVKDILLVEDEKELAHLLVMFLEKAGYSVDVALSGEEALDRLKGGSVKLLLLDIMLPELDGFAVLREVRKSGNIPVIIISARVGKEDKLNGFELGADDYIEKPVDADILAAKVRSLLARSYGAYAKRDIIQTGDITIDKTSRRVWKNNEPVELNVKEYELLLLLVENKGKTMGKDYIFSRIWGMDSLSENQTLTVHIKMLRDKIEDNPKMPIHIKTVWGVGYRYD